MYKTLAVLLAVAAVAYSQSCVNENVGCAPVEGNTNVLNNPGGHNVADCCQNCADTDGCNGWAIGPQVGCLALSSCGPVPQDGARVGNPGCGC